MNWLTPPNIYFVIGLIFILSILVYRFRKPIGSEFKKWRVKSLQFLGLTLEREPTIKPLQPPTLDEPLTEETRKAAKLNALRRVAGPISHIKAQELTEEILGNKSHDFWKQIAENVYSHSDLYSLTEEPFFLEGLIHVFEKENGKIPKNIGTFLDKLIIEQWTPDKLEVQKNGWIELDEARKAFAGAINYHHPEVEYPVQPDIESRYWRGRDLFEEFMITLGEPPRKHKEDIVIRLITGLASIFNKNPETFLPELVEKNKFARFLLIAFYLLFHPLELLAFPLGFLNSLIRWLFRKIGLWWLLDKIESFKLKLSLTRRRNKERGRKLLELGQKACILEVVGKKVVFKNSVWVDYFYAYHHLNYATSDLRSVIPTTHYSSSWNRLDSNKDKAVVMICGLVNDPDGFINLLIPLDPYVAAQCIASGVDGVADQTRLQTYQRLKENMLDLQSGGEERCCDSAKYLRVVWSDPAAVLDILETIEKLGPYQYHIFKLVGIIAEYGNDIVDMLINRLERSKDIRVYIARALAYIGTPRVLPVLRELAKNNDSYLKILALTLLAVFFNDPDATTAMHQYMFAEHGDEEGKTAWQHLYTMDQKTLGFELAALTSNIDRFKGTRDGRTTFEDEWWFGRDKFLKGAKRFSKSEMQELLVNALLHTKDDELMTVLATAIGHSKGKQAYLNLLSIFQETPNKFLRTAIIHAFGEMRETRAVNMLIAQVENHDIQMADAAISALGKVGSIMAIEILEKKLRDDTFVHKYDSTIDHGFPISFQTMCALVEIGAHEFKEESQFVLKERRRALNLATDWCAANANSTQKVGFNESTLGKTCLNYLDYKIPLERAHHLYAELRPDLGNS